MGEIISQSSRTRNSRRKSPKKHTPMFLKRITPHVLCVIEVSQKRLAIVVTSELERWGCKHEMNTFWLYINNNHTSTFGGREFVENAEYVRESQRPILDMLFISRKCQLSALQKKQTNSSSAKHFFTTLPCVPPPSWRQRCKHTVVF